MDWFLNQASTTQGKGPERKKENWDNYERYRRISATYLSLFGGFPFNKDGQLESAKNWPKGVFRQGTSENCNLRLIALVFYGQMRDRFCSGNTVENNYLYCTDQGYKFIENDEVDPGDSQGRKISETRRFLSVLDSRVLTEFQSRSVKK